MNKCCQESKLTLYQLFELSEENWTPDEMDLKFMSMSLDKQLLAIYIMLRAMK